MYFCREVFEMDPKQIHVAWGEYGALVDLSQAVAEDWTGLDVGVCRI